MTERKLQMKTTKFDFNGKQVTVGVLKKFEDAIPLLETPFLIKAINAEYGTNLRLIRPHVADHLLNNTENWQEIEEVFPVPVSAVIAYERSRTRKLPNVILFEDEESDQRLMLPTKQYKGKHGIALMVSDITADDITKDGDDIRIAAPYDRLIVVPNFPSYSGWHMPHAETTVPHGEGLEHSSDGARVLMRLEGSSYVGFPVRGNFCTPETVDVCHGPSYEAGVAVEVPSEDLKKIEVLAR